MPKSLTKTPDQFSEDAWDLLLASEKEARKWRHEYLDVEHMLQVLITDEKYIKIVNALPINNDELLNIYQPIHKSNLKYIEAISGAENLIKYCHNKKISLAWE